MFFSSNLRRKIGICNFIRTLLYSETNVSLCYEKSLLGTPSYPCPLRSFQTSLYTAFWKCVGFPLVATPSDSQGNYPKELTISRKLCRGKFEFKSVARCLSAPWISSWSYGLPTYDFSGTRYSYCSTALLNSKTLNFRKNYHILHITPSPVPPVSIYVT